MAYGPCPLTWSLAAHWLPGTGMGRRLLNEQWSHVHSPLVPSAGMLVSRHGEWGGVLSWIGPISLNSVSVAAMVQARGMGRRSVSNYGPMSTHPVRAGHWLQGMEARSVMAMVPRPLPLGSCRIGFRPSGNGCAFLSAHMVPLSTPSGHVAHSLQAGEWAAFYQRIWSLSTHSVPCCMRLGIGRRRSVSGIWSHVHSPLGSSCRILLHGGISGVCQWHMVTYVTTAQRLGWLQVPGGIGALLSWLGPSSTIRSSCHGSCKDGERGVLSWGIWSASTHWFLLCTAFQAPGNGRVCHGIWSRPPPSVQLP
ncbi:hypothetical protein AVEN_34595-1 [Araneus ventricosus]|uniref:Uncharacterized protein n=1 Tax=Araneus ventricosus TaxID=182803 RepID=A0A4Y2B238_ARAVE|nr:hypothetical protein AVEN_34595-1 [Araneus ventricosus]